MLKELKIVTRDVGELEAWASCHSWPARVQTRTPGRDLGVSALASRVKGVTVIWGTSYGDLHVEPQVEHDCVSFRFCTKGGLLFYAANKTFENPAGTALALNNFSSLDVVDRTCQTTVAIDTALLRNRLNCLLDRPLREELKFASDPVPIDGMIALLAGFLSQWRETPLFKAGRPLLERSDSIANMLADMMLLMYPNNISDQLRRAPTMIAPRHVKRAIDYIHAYPNRQASPAELADLSNVSVRALQYSFQAFTGQTISTFQRDFRLQKSRADVIEHLDLPLNTIASKWGFGSAAHFSQAFKEKYSITPSEARRSAKK